MTRRPSPLTGTLPAQVSPPGFALADLYPATVVGADVVALPVLAPESPDGSVLLGPGADDAAAQVGVDLYAVAELHGLTGATGEVASVPVPDGTPANPDLRLVLLVGVGAGTAVDVRRAGAALAKAVRDRAAVATSIPAAADATPQVLEAFVAGTMLGSFVFHWRSEGPPHRPVGRVVIAAPGVVEDNALLERAVALGGAGWRSRTLATVPSNLKNPPWLAEQARALADVAGLDVRVWDEDDLAAEGFGGILAVGRGSATPPRLIRIDYVPRGISGRAARKLPRVVLVGKGITFDSGGLSIKPAQSMVSMKRDMTGGGVVLAMMAALADVDCPVRVTGLVPTAENAISGTSLRPGDVVRHWGGRTTEVTNTDAEGRLVLADALSYAVAELDPAVVVDVATLTGGVKLALGQQVAGLFATDDTLADALRGAGERAGEPLWRFPMFAGYEEKLSSKVADADNGAAGPAAIMAALFLQHFVRRPGADRVPWAHLDIASVGDVEKEWHEWTVGPSGFGARLLLTWLGSPEPLAGINPKGARR